MSRKGLLLLGASAGTFIGSIAPSLWGGDLFSPSAILIATIGGLVGIWVVYKIT